MTIARTEEIFGDHTFDFAFDDLFRTDKTGRGNGPMTIILRDYPILPAKGGAHFPDTYDMTYFNHVCNASIMAGRMFQYYLKENGLHPEDHMLKIKLLFAAMVMHDFNKIFRSGDKGAAKNLEATFEAFKSNVAGMVGAYLDDVGGIEKLMPDLKFLILSTEIGTREQANLIETTVSRPELSTLSDFLRIGDSMSSGLKTGTDSEVFDNFNAAIGKFVKMSEHQVEDIRMIRFADIPQTLLRIEFSNIVFEFLREKKAVIYLKTPDAIIYQGPDISNYFDEISVSKDFQKLIGTSSDVPSGSELNDLLTPYKPGNNNINLDFAKDIPPIPKVLDAYIEKFGRKILLWSGKEWTKEHSDFKGIAKSWGVDLEAVNDRFTLNLVEGDTEHDPDLKVKRCRVKFVLLKRIQAELKGIDAPEFSETVKFLKEKGLIDSKTHPILQKTLVSIACVRELVSDPCSSYDKLLSDVSSFMEQKYNFNRAHLTDPKSMLNYFFGTAYFDEKDLKMASKEQMCIQCGRPGVSDLNESTSFGYKPTHGGKKKVSVLSYNEKTNGKLCRLCEIENHLRASKFHIHDKDSALCMRVHLGDFISPIKIEQLSKGPAEGFITISKKERFQIDYHTLYFIDFPGTVIDQFYCIKNIIEIISTMGVKISLSPLFMVGSMFKPMFQWENSPGWVKNLGWDYLRIDEIEGVKEDMDFIEFVARLRRGYKDIPDVIKGFMRGPGGVLGKAWQYHAGKGSGNSSPLFSSDGISKTDSFLKKYSKVLKMEKMKKLVENACLMVRNAPETNSEHTWFVREAFDTYARQKALRSVTREDIVYTIAGRLRDEAMRRNDVDFGKALIEGSETFAEYFVEMLEEKFGGRFPNSEHRKDIIAQFSIMYHKAKWNEVTQTKESKETVV